MEILERRDLSDALRVEIGERPDFHSVARLAVETIQSVIYRDMGKFFGLETLAKSADIKNRVVLFGDHQSFLDFLSLILKADREREMNLTVGVRTCEDAGSIIALPLGYYFTDKAVEAKRAMEKSGATEKEAAANIGSFNLFCTLCHETLHAYEDSDLPTFFTECAIPYYVEGFLISMNRPDLSDPLQTKRSEFFGKLLDKYGDEPHRLFFGSLNNKVRRLSILSEFNHKVRKELFPDGYGISKRSQNIFK